MGIVRDRESKWTKIYWDVDPNCDRLKPYVRLVPEFMDCEFAGFSHGLSLGGTGGFLIMSKKQINLPIRLIRSWNVC